ncbi:MAG: phosphate/phosphite/phosphonate ABC transporter substrate-binding protein [Geobacter sp.]|nr:phosphate/phosphite/phosphonate ABC transporter substrate-binding protein [Geobacter sp.]
MKRLLCYLLVLLGMALQPIQAAAADQLILGVAPHTSARIILEMYQPLRLHLEKEIGMPVDVVTAPDFTVFAQRGLQQEFDIAVTTGQQARLLQVDAGYLPLLTYQADFKAVALVAAASPYRRAADLQGKSALGLSPTSQVTVWGQHWLEDNGLKGMKIRYVSASDSVAQLLVAGEAAVGFTSLANYQKLTPELQQQLKILAQSRSMAGRIYLLNKRRAGLQKKIEAALWSFAASEAGKKYFSTNRLEGYRLLERNELQSMDRYAAEVRRVLAGSK